MNQTIKQMIKRLVMMRSYTIGEDYEALDYAISSIKANEGGEIFTKADIEAMLTEIQAGIGENIKSWNHQQGWETEWSEGADWCIYYIQTYIDALKGEGNKTDKKASD